MTYTEPPLAVLVLDFEREEETRACLASIRDHIKIPHKVIYLHNGPADYPSALLKEGLIHQLIQPATNNGLGIGTRDLFAASFSRYSLYLQPDQVLRVDITPEVFANLTGMLGGKMMLQIKDEPTPRDSGWTVASVSLAGQVCGPSEYSERAHLIETAFYKGLEWNGLPCHGAGPYHDGEWREATIQRYYREHQLIHATHLPPLVEDRGYRARRQNPDGSVWEHQPDTKALTLVRGPVRERYVYPKLSPREWESVLATQAWPAGQIPEDEVKDSFTVPHWHA
jgi:hypothetical protein